MKLFPSFDEKIKFLKKIESANLSWLIKLDFFIHRTFPTISESASKLDVT